MSIKPTEKIEAKDNNNIRVYFFIFFINLNYKIKELGQVLTRLSVIHIPLKGPCFSIALRPYSEQLGLYLQLAKNKGEIAPLYSIIKARKITENNLLIPVQLNVVKLHLFYLLSQILTLCLAVNKQA